MNILRFILGALILALCSMAGATPFLPMDDARALEQPVTPAARPVIRELSQLRTELTRQPNFKPHPLEHRSS